MDHGDMLDLRKRAILQAVIEDYIMTAEPIGSRTIARRHDLGLSSATIRNEMSDLEEMGFLLQPHTSAGRIPSEKGYRFYVDELVKNYELTVQELQNIRDGLDKRINDMEDAIKQASRVISELTDYTAIAITPHFSNIRIKAIQIVPVEPGTALIVTVLDGSTIRNSMVSIDESIKPEDLIVLSAALNERFAGKTIEHVDPNNIHSIINKMNMRQEQLVPILEGIAECIRSATDSDVYTDGAVNIFNHPEFNDVVRAREFFAMMQEKDKVLAMMANSISDGGIVIKIGKENMFDEIKDCSVITATYSVNNKMIGSIGIIGPTRMNYRKAIASMDVVTKSLSKQISYLMGDNRIESDDNNNSD